MWFRRFREGFQPVQNRLARGAPVYVSVAVRLVIGLAVMVLVGTLLLSLPGMTTRPLTLGERFFTATSAVTVTGLAVATTSVDFTFLGQVVILLLVQTGGLGFVVMFVLALNLIGRPLSLTDRLALTSELGLNKPGAIQKALTRTLLIMLVIETIGAILLFIHWRINGIVDGDKTLFYAIFHAITAFCNAGFDLFYGLGQFPEGLPNDPITLLILGLLIFMGGIGTPVYIDILFRKAYRRLSLSSRLSLIAAGALILIGTIGILIGEMLPGGVLTEYPTVSRVSIAMFQSVSARTAGFPGLQSFDQLHQSSRLLLVGLMFIGSGPASMGGGITTGTLTVLTVAMVGYIRGESGPYIFGRKISPGSIRRAVAVLLMSLGVISLATWLLLVTHPLTMDRALFEVVSAYSTVGLSLGVTPQLNEFGRLLIALVMFWGRLGAVTIMIVLIQRRTPSQLIAYPEETVLVG